MKTLSFILLFLSVGSLTAIFDTNDLITQAENLFSSKEYKKSATILDSLLDNEALPKEALELNLAHAYFLQSDTTNLKQGKNYYSLLSSGENKAYASISYNQIGNVDYAFLTQKNPQIIQGQLDPSSKEKLKEILEQYKDALRANPDNEEARYNYELLQWLLHTPENEDQENKDQQNQDQNKDQENKDQKQDQKNKDKEGQDKKDQQKGDKKDQKDGKDQDNKDGQKGEDGKKDKDSKQGDQKNSKQSQEDKKGEEQKQGQKGKKQKAEEGKDGKPSQQIKLSKEQAMQLIRSGQNKEKKYFEREMKKSSEPIDNDKPDW